MTKRIIVATLGVALCAGGCAFWHVYGAQSMTQPQAPAPAVAVVAERLQASDVPIVMTGIGTVVAYNVVDVHAQVAGTINQIGFVEGQTVQPGNLIAQLDPRPFQAALQEAEANLARDQANLANARVNLGRYTPLLKQGFASAQQVTDQASTVTQLEASVAGDKATIFNAQTQLGYTTITSPIDGVTGIKKRRHWQRSPAEFHHADRDDHADPADIGCLHAAAEGRTRRAGGDGQGRAHRDCVRPGRSYQA
jgi:multidrug efflux system membrane fusion protein